MALCLVFKRDAGKKAILHAKLHSEVIVLVICLHFLGKSNHKGSRRLVTV